MAASDATPNSDEWRFTGGGCRSNAKVRLAALAAKQWGRARYEQIRRAGVSSRTIGRWSNGGGYLFWELPRVYAIGHPGRTPASDLAAAVLYAGPGGMLSAASAIWWVGLLKYPPRQIYVSTPRRVQDYDLIAVHGRRKLERVFHKGMPMTTPNQAILDYAATNPRTDLLRFVLANAEYEGVLDIRALQALTGRGIAGSAAVNDALQIHLPQLAHTRSRAERLLLIVLQAANLPIPKTNVYVNGWLVDAFWPQHRLIVEIDGTRGHRTPAQIRRDHQRDLELRAAGYIVLRYTEEQLQCNPEAILTELRRYL
jgi:very-short-patch-repair endonuclease